MALWKSTYMFLRLTCGFFPDSSYHPRYTSTETIMVPVGSYVADYWYGGAAGNLVKTPPWEKIHIHQNSELPTLGEAFTGFVAGLGEAPDSTQPEIGRAHV